MLQFHRSSSSTPKTIMESSRIDMLHLSSACSAFSCSNRRDSSATFTKSSPIHSSAVREAELQEG